MQKRAFISGTSPREFPPDFLKSGEALKGFFPKWVGEFYAYYQWYYNVPSIEVIQNVPISFLKKAYLGLNDLDLELAVQKVGLE